MPGNAAAATSSFPLQAPTGRYAIARSSGPGNAAARTTSFILQAPTGRYDATRRCAPLGLKRRKFSRPVVFQARWAWLSHFGPLARRMLAHHLTVRFRPHCGAASRAHLGAVPFGRASPRSSSRPLPRGNRLSLARRPKMQSPGPAGLATRRRGRSSFFPRPHRGAIGRVVWRQQIVFCPAARIAGKGATHLATEPGGIVNPTTARSQSPMICLRLYFRCGRPV